MPRSLIAVLASSFVLKLALLIPAHRIVPFYDSADYVGAAAHLAKTGEYDSLRAPGYPAMLAAVFRVADSLGLPMHPKLGAPSRGLTALDLARFLQVVISTITVFLIFDLVRRFFDERAALVAAAIFAFYPNLIGYTHYLWSETLFLALMVGGVIIVARAADSQRFVTAMTAGVVLGLGALTRQVGLVVVGVAAVWIWIDVATEQIGLTRRPPFLAKLVRPGAASALALAILLGAVLAIVPWTLRNLAHHDEMVLISASGGVGLLFGAVDDPIGELKKLNEPSLRFDALKRDRRCAELARKVIAADPAGWVVRCFTHNLPSLFQPVFDGVMSHVFRDDKAYGRLPPWLTRTVLLSLVASYGLLACFAIAGLWLSDDRRLTLFYVGLLLAFMASHVTILGVTRHRLPLETMAMPFAGFLLSRTWPDLRARLSRERGLGILLSLLAFAGVVSMSEIDRAAYYWLLAGAGAGPGSP